MTVYAPNSDTLNVNYFLNEGDKFVVKKGITVESTGQFSHGVYTEGTSTVLCDGTIKGGTGAWLVKGSVLRVGEAGTIKGQSLGVLVNNSSLSNHGDVSGGTIGVELANANLTNTGLIVSGRGSDLNFNAAIAIDTVDNLQSSDINNSGVIKALQVNSFAIRSTGSSTDAIYNSGNIIGKISLGGGNDVLDTSYGKVVGIIDGGSGADKITGSTYADKIKGGADNDMLTGKGGADSLSGGAGADTFVFKTLSDSKAVASGRDAIQDFSHSQHDHIDLHLIDANSHSGGNQAFHFIGSHAFGHHAGELQAKAAGTNTMVSGDVNGDGNADFSVLLHGHVALNNGDFLL